MRSILRITSSMGSSPSNSTILICKRRLTPALGGAANASYTLKSRRPPTMNRSGTSTMMDTWSTAHTVLCTHTCTHKRRRRFRRLRLKTSARSTLFQFTPRTSLEPRQLATSLVVRNGEPPRPAPDFRRMEWLRVRLTRMTSDPSVCGPQIPRLIANLAVLGAQIFGRAFVEAYEPHSPYGWTGRVPNGPTAGTSRR